VVSLSIPTPLLMIWIPEQSAASDTLQRIPSLGDQSSHWRLLLRGGSSTGRKNRPKGTSQSSAKANTKVLLIWERITLCNKGRQQLYGRQPGDPGEEAEQEPAVLSLRQIPAIY